MLVATATSGAQVSGSYTTPHTLLMPAQLVQRSRRTVDTSLPGKEVLFEAGRMDTFLRPIGLVVQVLQCVEDD